VKLLKEILTYVQIGHNSASVLWVYKDGEFKKADAVKYGDHGEWWNRTRDPVIFRADFVGRYDPRIKTISIGKPGIEPITKADIPMKLLNLLNFEFGGDNKLKVFE
jgi:hypothetical protein